jgi:hypothetical protein
LPGSRLACGARAFPLPQGTLSQPTALGLAANAAAGASSAVEKCLLAIALRATLESSWRTTHGCNYNLHAVECQKYAEHKIVETDTGVIWGAK